MFGSQGTFRGAPRLRVLKPLIFRLTPRGLDRLCVFTDNTDAISTRTLLSQDFRCSGGNSDGGGETALEDTHRMDVRQILGGLSGAARRFKHHAADGGVGNHPGVELLQDQIGRFATQGSASVKQMDFGFVECRLDLPASVVKGSQLRGGGSDGTKPVDRR